ncbi:hypothetical protein U5801_28310 [Lamprobacter modestohalophilus]|nr:hypothetical protein [Lamprobacter modestohalophilus]MEA1053681.1 hypothetical protein [Lamprobacter modestohalophilus]
MRTTTEVNKPLKVIDLQRIRKALADRDDQAMISVRSAASCGR